MEEKLWEFYYTVIFMPWKHEGNLEKKSPETMLSFFVTAGVHKFGYLITQCFFLDCAVFNIVKYYDYK